MFDSLKIRTIVEGQAAGFLLTGSGMMYFSFLGGDFTCDFEESSKT